MADLTMVFFECFPEDLAEKVHNLGSDALTIALSNVAPTAATDDELVDITQIAAGYGYTTGGEALTVTSSTQTSGEYNLIITSNIVWTATGGDIAAKRYIVLYNNTAANDELICYWDIGASAVISEGDTYTANLAGVTLFNFDPPA